MTRQHLSRSRSPVLPKVDQDLDDLGPSCPQLLGIILDGDPGSLYAVVTPDLVISGSATIVPGPVRKRLALVQRRDPDECMSSLGRAVSVAHRPKGLQATTP